MVIHRREPDLFYLDENGKRQDAALDEKLLNNPRAERRASQAAASQVEHLARKEET